MGAGAPRHLTDKEIADSTIKRLNLAVGQKWFLKLNPRSNKLDEVEILEIRGQVIRTTDSELSKFGLGGSPNWYAINDINFIQKA